MSVGRGGQMGYDDSSAGEPVAPPPGDGPSAAKFLSGPRGYDMAAELPTGVVRCVRLARYGGYDALQPGLQYAPTGVSGDQVVIETSSLGMNFMDVYLRQGIFRPPGVSPPYVLGAECAGRVLEAGPDSPYRPGDRVVAWNFKCGMWSGVVRVSSSQVAPIPDSMSFEHAAALPINYVTAWMALGGSLPERCKTILVQGAGGGVGIAAVQLIQAWRPGAHIIGVASPAKHQFLKEMGVNTTLDYGEALEHARQCGGVDLILDILGGSGFPAWVEAGALRPGGRVMHIGASSAIKGEKLNVKALFSFWIKARTPYLKSLIDYNASVGGVNIAKLYETHPAVFHEAVNAILDLYCAGKVRPHIDSTWTLSDVKSATRRLADRKNVGKVLLDPRH